MSTRLLVTRLGPLLALLVFCAPAQAKLTGGIYTMNTDGSGLTKIVNKSTVYAADWSPDGTEIAFSEQKTDREFLYTVNHDGTGLSKVPIKLHLFATTSITWSPDSTQLAFSELGRNDNQSVVVVNRTSGAYKQVTKAKLFSAFEPAWSPDGKRIAFTICGRANCEIDTVATDGTSRKLLVDKATDPIWSSDGTKLAFMNYRYSVGAKTKIKFSTVNADGTAKETLTTLPTFVSRRGLIAYDVSSDLSSVLFAAEHQKKQIFDGYDAYTMKSDGSQLAKILSLRNLDTASVVRFSPDGQRILLVSNGGRDV